MEDCHVCGKEVTDKGIPVWEDFVVHNEWRGEWGGVPACEGCYWKQQQLIKPVSFYEFERLRAQLLFEFMTN
jgi:hypothetical protein